MSRCRPALDGDAALAEAVRAEVAPAEAKHVSASKPVTCFDPAQFPLPGAYSVDGMTAIAPVYFPEPGLVKRACNPPAGRCHAPKEPGDTRLDDDSRSRAEERQNADIFDTQIC
jgi:hypothetical protein